MNVGPQFTHIKDLSLRNALLTVNHPHGEEYQGQWDDERNFIHSKGYALDGNKLHQPPLIGCDIPAMLDSLGVCKKKAKKAPAPSFKHGIDFVEIGHELDADVAQEIAHAFKDEVEVALHWLYKGKTLQKAIDGLSVAFYGSVLEIVDGFDDIVLDDAAVRLFCEVHGITLGQLVAIISEQEEAIGWGFSGDVDLPIEENFTVPTTYNLPKGSPFKYADAKPIPDTPKPAKKRKKKAKEVFHVVPPGATITVTLNKPKRRLG